MSSVILHKLLNPCRQTHLKAATFGNSFEYNGCSNKCRRIDTFNRRIATINIESKISLVDEKIQTVIHGLDPNAKGEYLVIFVTIVLK